MRRLIHAFYRTVYPRLSGSGIHKSAWARWMEERLRSMVCSNQAELEGHRLILDPGDSLKLSILDAYEPEVTALMKQRIHLGDTVVDVGAHIGYFTLLLARLVGPRGRVYAFEPDPDNFALLEKNVAGNGYANIVAEQKAVSDRSGAMYLYRSPDNPADHRIFDSADDRATMEVPAVALDEYFSGQPDLSLSFIKADVQGTEDRVLAGMAGLLARSETIELVLEFWPAALGASGGSAESLLDRLHTFGFSVYPIEGLPNTLQPATREALCQRYTAARYNFTNLYCRRGDA